MVVVALDSQLRVDLLSRVHSVLTSAVDGVWQAATTSPVIGILLVAAVVAGSVRTARRARYSSWDRDDVRRFSRADTEAVLARAGHRCERHVPFSGRCRTTTGLRAGHVHPWARGGHTVLANGQALCRRHHHDKRAHVPSDRQLRKIEARRAGYFPAGTCAAVQRRRVTTGFAARTVTVTTSVGAPVQRGQDRKRSSRDGAERAGLRH